MPDYYLKSALKNLYTCDVGNFNSIKQKPEFASAAEYPDQVIIKYKNHQGTQQYKTYLLKDFHGSQIKRFAQNSLNREKNEVPTIKNRNGEEVQNSQVDTQHPHEIKKIISAGFHTFTCNFRNKYRSPQF
jgi:hypothetical protein